VARELLADWLGKNPGARLRLLGVGGGKLSPAEQPDLFTRDDGAAPEGIDQAADEIRDRFGTAAVGRASTLRRR